jgi:ketosteroid isomerase-like protein
MTANSLIAEISSYYKAYADAFHARSGTQIADFYCTPCISMRGDASIHCFQSRPETEKFFQGVADTYYEEGLRRSEIKNLEVVPIGGRSLLA